MENLRSVPIDVWNRIEGHDYRSKFFVDCYIEKLRMQTPPFHQARLMNVFSACEEMLRYLQEYADNDKNGAYVESALDEIKRCFLADSVAAELFKDHHQFIRDVSGNTFSTTICQKLAVICKSILNTLSDYRQTLKTELRETVVQEGVTGAELRTIQKIDSLTGLYITDLLNRGYSPTYLFNRSDYLAYASHYGGKNFKDQFDSVVAKLTAEDLEFQVYYAISATKRKSLPEAHSSLSFVTALPALTSRENKDKLNKDFDTNLYCRFTVRAQDYISAALHAKENLAVFLDTFLPFDPKSDVKISGCALVIHPSTIHNHQHCVNVRLLGKLMINNSGVDTNNHAMNLDHLIAALDDSSSDQLSRSLRHLRLARETPSLEQKMLNLWISLEALFLVADGTIIGGIMDCVPQIYAVQGLVRRLRYMKALLIANRTAIPTLAQTAMSTELTRFTKNINDNQMFVLFKNDDACNELYESVAGKEHLRFRILTLRTEFTNNKSIHARLESTQKDVNLQLRRIYFYRNKIAHTGHFQNVKPQLIMHLTDYLYMIFSCLSDAALLARNNQKYSIAELIMSARMGADKVIAASKHTSSQILSYSGIELKPIM